MIILDFSARLDNVLAEAFDSELFAAVSVVQSRDKFLLGLAKNTNDDRDGRWVFPGGHIKSKETPEKAAERECREETGVRCKAVGKAFTLPNKRGIAFVHCKATPGQGLDNNHEFSALGFFTRKEMKSLKLYGNVLKLIDRVTR